MKLDSLFNENCEKLTRNVKRYWDTSQKMERGQAIDPTARKRDCLRYLGIVASYLHNSKFASDMPKRMVNHACAPPCDDFPCKVVDFAFSIVTKNHNPNVANPLRGSSTTPALVKFTGVLLALEYMMRENVHVGVADSLVEDWVPGIGRSKEQCEEILAWCKALTPHIVACRDLAIEASCSLPSPRFSTAATQCLKLANDTPLFPGLKSLADSEAKGRAFNAEQLENEDEDGFGPVSVELKGTPIEKQPVSTALALFPAPPPGPSSDHEENVLLSFGRGNPPTHPFDANPPALAPSPSVSNDVSEFTFERKRPMDYNPLVYHPIESGDETGDEADDASGRASPVYDMSGAADLVPAPAEDARVALGKRTVDVVAHAGNERFKKARSSDEQTNEHADLLDTRTSIALAMYQYTLQLQRLNYAGPHFAHNLVWACDEVRTLVKDLEKNRRRSDE